MAAVLNNDHLLLDEESRQVLSVSRNLIDSLGYEKHITALREFIDDWVAHADAEIKNLLFWQFKGNCKYFRPMTIFACYEATSNKPVDNKLLARVASLEFFHNVSLIIDDILDRSRTRRGKATLHCKFGSLPALMASGFITAEGFRIVKNDAYAIERLAELLKRLGIAECMQWRLRRHPLGVEDWRIIAGEDTGSMFEVCACLATSDESLRHYGHFLGMLYHGCDDVSDVRGSLALGGGGKEDIRDGILTLPVSMAIKDVSFAKKFREGKLQDITYVTKKLNTVLPEAEAYLDTIKMEAINEAMQVSKRPDKLLILVEHTRGLSRI